MNNRKKMWQQMKMCNDSNTGSSLIKSIGILCVLAILLRQ